MNTNYSELISALLPEIALTIGLLVVLAADLAFGRRLSDCARKRIAVILGIVTIGVASCMALVSNEAWFRVSYFDGKEALFYDAFKPDNPSCGVLLGVFLLSALTLLLVSGNAEFPLGDGAKRRPNLPSGSERSEKPDNSALPAGTAETNPKSKIQNPKSHALAEYIAIQLLATIGFSLMAVSNNLLIAFLGLELASLSLYIMAGFDKTSRESAEAGLKYFLFGGMAAAFMLFGFSLIYGLTGTLSFPEIAQSLSDAAVSDEMPLAMQGLSPLLLVALVMTLVGFGYKAAAAPFHFWAPDVYQGAPAPAAALIASASKLAGVAFFARLLYAGLAPAAGSFDSLTPTGWVTVIVLISAASILLGNLVALAQTNLRRLIAYSAIAHAGAMLIAVIAQRAAGPAPLYYYALTYGLATIGIFGVIAIIERATAAPCQRIADLAGLWKRSPFLAAVLFVCVLSLAGIPPLAGFFGKFYIFAAALSLAGLASPLGVVVLLAIIMSAVALYYYLIILKTALVANADVANAEKIRTPCVAALALTLIAILIIALGIFPSVILRMF